MVDKLNKAFIDILDKHDPLVEVRREARPI